jgi:hypothetical protein
MLKRISTSLFGGLLAAGTALVALNAQPPAPLAPPSNPPAVQPGAAPVRSVLAPRDNAPVAAPDVAPAPDARQPANVQPNQPTNTQPQNQHAQLFRAKQILGSKVQLSGNVAAGTVDDFVVAEDGFVEYVIVNNNNQFVTVPWDAASFNFEKQTAVINIAQEQFQKIPTYTADKYPTFSEPQYRTSVYRSYGLTPRDRPAILPRNRRP